MGRHLDGSMATALSSNIVVPVLLVNLTFRTQTVHIWTGVGDLSFGGFVFKGVGSLGKMGSITEGVDVHADGTSLTLSGIDPVLLQESMTDIQLGADASIFFGLMNNGAFIGTPYQLFAGSVDAPTVTVGASTLSITLALENKMVDLSRPSLGRYTSADQRRTYPDDTAFQFVEQLNDLALIWGQ